MPASTRHIEILVDRSGSMGSIKLDMEGGLKTFLETQRKEVDLPTTVSLAQFDDVYEVVYTGEDLATLDTDYDLEPRGLTALRDAIGKSVTSLRLKLKEKPKEERPEVVMVIITDGIENASREYEQTTIRQLLKKAQAKWEWTIIYLGANQDAIEEADKLGIRREASITYDVAHVHTSWEGTSKMVARGAVSGTYAFHADEREAAVGASSPEDVPVAE